MIYPGLAWKFVHLSLCDTSVTKPKSYPKYLMINLLRLFCAFSRGLSLGTFLDTKMQIAFILWVRIYPTSENLAFGDGMKIWQPIESEPVGVKISFVGRKKKVRGSLSFSVTKSVTSAVI